MAKVKYISIWEEGEVVSEAELDLTTGEVGSIIDPGYGDDYEFLIKEVIEYDGVRYECSRDEETDMYKINIEELKHGNV